MTFSSPRASSIWRTRTAPRFYWLYKSLDAVLTAPLTPKRAASQLLWSVFRPKSSNYNRISSAINLLDHIAPGSSQRLASSLLRLNHFPVKGFDVRLLAYGSGATVFLLENGQERKVLKVFRRSLAGPGHKVWEVAREFQEKHETLRAWFNHSEEMVIPSTFLVLHGPLLGAAAAAVLQPYVAGKVRDIFLDYSPDEAVSLLRSSARLKAQYLHFANQVLASMEEAKTCFDFVGRENLMLVENKGQMSFKIADNGVFNLSAIRVQSPALYNRLQEHIARLRKIKEELERLA